MKHERRTELKSNLLADRLEAAFLAVKPYLKLIGVSIATLVLLAIAMAIVSWRQEKASALAWRDYYFSANRAETLRDVYEEHPSQTAGLWARQASGDSLTGQALAQIYLDRDLADKLLAEAAEQYQAVLSQASEPFLLSRATLGLAQVLESQGKADEAVREYKKLMEMKQVHPEMLQDVQRRIDFLQSPEGQKFITWFKENRPTAPTPVELPDDLKNLPTTPDLKFSPMLPAAENTTAIPSGAAPAAAPSTGNDVLALPTEPGLAAPPDKIELKATPAGGPPPLEPPQDEATSPKGS